MIKAKNKISILILGLTILPVLVFGDVYWYCASFNTCGTDVSPEPANGCLGVTCPVSKICQVESNNSNNNCSQNAYMAQCSSYQYGESEPGGLGECEGSGVYVNPAPGGTVCEQCSVD